VTGVEILAQVRHRQGMLLDERDADAMHVETYLSREFPSWHGCSFGTQPNIAGSYAPFSIPPRNEPRVTPQYRPYAMGNETVAV
jgi:hypothetical protein